MAKSAGEKKDIEQVYVPKLSESKLKELTWELDIKENRNPVTPNQPTNNVAQPANTQNGL